MNTETRTTRAPRWISNRRRRIFLLSGITTLAFSGIASGAALADTGSPQGTAVVTPAFKLFDFGANVGIPEGCQLGIGTFDTATGQIPVSTATVTNQLGTQCQNLSQESDGYVQQGISASYSANAIDPLVNPGVSAMSSGLETLGNAAGGPLGPTIADLGGSVKYFEGQ